MAATAIACAALLLGALAGLGFSLIWRWLVPHSAHGRFWSVFGGASKDLMAVDEPSALWAIYKRLGRGLGVYLARNIGGVILGLAPLVLILFLAIEPLLGVASQAAGRLVATPAAADVTIVQPTSSTAGRIEGGRLPAPVDDVDLASRIAICTSGSACGTLATLGFQTIEAEASETVIVRAPHGQWSPFWPWLSGAEFLFYACFFITMTVTLIVPLRRRTSSMGQDLAQE